LTPKPVPDLIQIPKSVLDPEPLTLEPKLTISPYHNQLLDKGMQQYDSEMMFQDWTLDGDKYQHMIFQDHIQFSDYKWIEVNGESL